VKKKISCITFNYDDLFDQRLWEVDKLTMVKNIPYWHPDGGYGFFCNPSTSTIQNNENKIDDTSMLLLKLHGSMNWRIRKGEKKPYTIDSIYHHEDWLSYYEYPNPFSQNERETIEIHLEKDPFIIPPLLAKKTLTKQPLLKIIWTLAYKKLQSANNVIFIGYSMPKTDIASRFLFSEAIEDKTKILVINKNDDDDDKKKELMDSYKNVFPKLMNEDFKWEGALKWAEDTVVANPIEQPNPPPTSLNNQPLIT
jgi:hypothetical protein